MNYPLLQFVRLENLLDEAAGADALRVHVEERIEVKQSAALTRKMITVALCVRAIAPTNCILSWYYQVDTFGFYMQGEAVNGRFADGRSPEQERYETAWQQAEQMKDEIVGLLRDDEYTVYTDGIIALPALTRAENEPFSLLRGTTDLVTLLNVDTEPARSS